MGSKGIKQYALSDLQWLVLPAIAHGTYAIADAEVQPGAVSAPAAVLLWARVSPEIDAPS